MFKATISLAIAELQQNDPIFTSSYLPLVSSLPYGRMMFEQHQKEQIIWGVEESSLFSLPLVSEPQKWYLCNGGMSRNLSFI